ncbi:MAG: cobyrinate a,c-diamide synthase [Deltaproteobacteria bacterium]|nr:cobyrinate a,c-diamide synthase [Deltaproteobacteria bacterium]
MKAFIIAGTHSGVGKTTITLGLMSALRKRGVTVQPFKVGPDYIDPSYHKAVCGRPSYNLDTWMMGVDGVKDTFAKIMANAECITSPVSPSFIKRGMGGVAVGVIEGVMGLFDGKDGKDEYGSTAHVAKVLGIPVILVVDARSMARSAGALVYGYERFDPKVKIAAIIFNRVGSERHFKMLKQAVETKCRAKVLGYIPRDEEISLPERHLGLVMMQGSRGKGQARLKKIGELIERSVDVEGLLKIDSRLKVQDSRFEIGNRKSEIGNVKIAVALDNAFCFYYQENLDILKQLGAEIVFFSPLKEKRLPDDIDGIYLGGGYPELFAKKLEANKALRQHIKNLAEKGLPIYAECGGLMYLGKSLKDFKGEKHDMVGVFPWVSRMLEKRKTLGYREIKAAEDCLFLKKGQTMRGHEYHYSEIDEPSQKIKRGYRITHNPPSPSFTKGGQGGVEGYLYKNTLASYIHLHFASNPKFADGFVKLCRRKKSVNK